MVAAFRGHRHPPRPLFVLPRRLGKRDTCEAPESHQMAQRDVDLIRQGITALNRRDVDGMLATLHPKVELVPIRAVLDGTVYRGHAGLREWYGDVEEDWEEHRIDVRNART